MVQPTTIRRVFRFGATQLDDPNPTLSPAEALRLFTASYPFLAHATIDEGTLDGDTLVFTIHKPAVQTKG